MSLPVAQSAAIPVPPSSSNTASSTSSSSSSSGSATTTSSTSSSLSSSSAVVDKKEIYTYEAPWLIYGMNWSSRPTPKFRLAVGSFIEDYKNAVEIVALDEDLAGFVSQGSFIHPYPTTKLMFIPDKTGSREDLLATTGDYLRIWKISGVDDIKMTCLLNNNKNSEFCAPLTSFDWNETDPALIGTSSIDTTCTIWNVETHQAKTQLIAHDKEVYDLAFAPSTDVFASAGADGSVRMFDLRSLEHSTIIYESPELVPLLRLCFHPDQQLLTNQGFMFIHEILIYLQQHEGIQVASYNINTQTIDYRTLKHKDFVIKDYDGDMIDIINEDEVRRWEEQAAGEEGHTIKTKTKQQHGRVSHQTVNPIALSVTADHTMYARCGRSVHSPSRVLWGRRDHWSSHFHKMPAAQLLSTDEQAAVQLLSTPINGISRPQKQSSLPFMEKLSLHTAEQVAAFLSLYGYWLGMQGPTQWQQLASDNNNQTICLSLAAETDSHRSATVSEWLTSLTLTPGVDFSVQHSPSGITHYSFINGRWSNYFTDQYAANSVLSPTNLHREAVYVTPKQWLFPWVWQLSKHDIRELVSGLCLSSGSDDEIFTSVVPFRDALIVLLLHAGYSAYFVRHGLDGWSIRFGDTAECVAPIVRPATDIKQRHYKGRVWCATLPENSDHLLLVRRAWKDLHTDVVTNVSRPLIAGNCWNKHDHNYLATFLMEQQQVVILDIRAPSVPVAELSGHSQCVNTLAWAPHSSCHICTGGDDCQALIWDLTQMPKPITEPILAYNAEAEINTLQWSAAQPEWVAIAFNKKLQILRV